MLLIVFLEYLSAKLLLIVIDERVGSSEKKVKINNEIKETKLDKKIDKMNKKNDITKIISIYFCL